MLHAFAVLLLFQCLGEALAFLAGLPVPGPVLGMLLLLAALVAWPRLFQVVESGANELLRHLSLLFLPAGVGIVAAAASGSGHWLAIVAAVVFSTLLTLAVTALVLKAFGPGSAVEPREGGDA
ncbi:CidA/LrgA family protein [Massilia forsythiae]|uniref:CidA/LrgA family protein n=1 Tax=Massilia forsythiae TaxID=2728020 RepID=A0A7Z2ZUB0_9BURK|nr:CidA/LrgA family protein [Massilia forsythiae]QJE02229.1 CidA/LrgA family protein [Massilia forsythiae]